MFMDIPYIFLICSIYIPKYVPYIFPCVLLNLWSQQKTSPYRKPTYITFYSLYTLQFLLAVLSFVLELCKQKPICIRITFAFHAYFRHRDQGVPVDTAPQKIRYVRYFSIVFH